MKSRALLLLISWSRTLVSKNPNSSARSSDSNHVLRTVPARYTAILCRTRWVPRDLAPYPESTARDRGVPTRYAAYVAGAALDRARVSGWPVMRRSNASSAHGSVELVTYLVDTARSSVVPEGYCTRSRCTHQVQHDFAPYPPRTTREHNDPRVHDATIRRYFRL